LDRHGGLDLPSGSQESGATHGLGGDRVRRPVEAAADGSPREDPPRVPGRRQARRHQLLHGSPPEASGTRAKAYNTKVIANDAGTATVRSQLPKQVDPKAAAPCLRDLRMGNAGQRH
jgi:hypothetical protein